MEVGAESPSHFCKFTNSVNIIDRFFCSATCWMMCQTMTDARAIVSPEALSSKGVSAPSAF
eukprot:4978677-Pyramimonas_sp.AAC.1